MTKPLPLTNRARAFSYVRFSTPEQQRGDSFRRQTEAAERYAATHGLNLDTRFTFHDLGVSAYRGRNRVDGMLGEFLSFVRSGDIPRGSYLLVENLDRVSRENALDAIDTLKDIAREGVTIVTLSDGREYTIESLRQNPIDFIVAVMMFMRANEESATKARRLKEAWTAKRRRAWTQPLTAVCPGWLRLRGDRTAYEIIPERAAIVRRVFDMTLSGAGQHSIAKALNREGVPVFGRGKMWHRSYIKKLLADPSTFGRHTPHTVEVIEGKKVRTATEPVEGYFPAVICRETFDRVASLSSGRPAQRFGGLANILAGLARCPQCGSTMTRVSKGAKGGKPYLVCTTAKAGKGCDYRQVRLQDVEDAITRNAGELWATLPSPDAHLQEQWEQANLAEQVTADEIEQLVDFIARGERSQAVVDRLRFLETARDDLRRATADLGARVADSLTNRVHGTLGRLTEVCEQENGPKDLPLINATLRQLFDRVVVDYLQGALQLHWRHAQGEVSRVVYAWPKECHGSTE